MKLVGTEGQKLYQKEKYTQKSANRKPVFKRSELIEKYEIKSSLSRSKGDNVKNAPKSVEHICYVLHTVFKDSNH